MIGDAIEAVLPLQRDFARSLMQETCTIERVSSQWDEQLQRSVTTTTVVAADVPCYGSGWDTSGPTLVTDETVAVSTPTIHAPHTLAGVRRDDRITHSSGAVMWVSDVPLDPYPVETLVRCRWVQ